MTYLNVVLLYRTFVLLSSHFEETHIKKKDDFSIETTLLFQLCSKLSKNTKLRCVVLTSRPFVATNGKIPPLGAP